MKLFNTLCAAAALLSTVASASAQSDDSISRWSVGVTGAYSRSYHTGGFRSYGDPSCGVFSDGSGSGYQAGIAGRFAPGGLLALDVRATLDSRPGIFESTSGNCQLIVPSSPEPIVQKVYERSEIVYELATLDMMLTARAPLGDAIAFTASLGPTVSIVRNGRITQYQEIISPDSARFLNVEGYPTENDGRRVYFARDMKIPQMSSTRFSIKAGVGLEGELVERLTLRGGVYYDRALTDVTVSENWQVHSLLGELTVLFAL
jgi:opacity protein-like surface antigen